MKKISSIAVSDAMFTKAIIGRKIQNYSIREKTNATNISGFPNQANFYL